MKVAALMIAAVIVILMMPAALISIDEFRLDDQVDTYIETTDATTNTTSVTLSLELFGDNIRLAACTSNDTDDAPIVSTYTSATKALLIIGLDESTTRLLTVTYSVDALDDYWGASTGARVWPILLIIGVIGIITGAVYTSTRSRGGD